MSTHCRHATSDGSSLARELEDANRHRCLVIVPCGRRKVWDAKPERGPTRAADAYTGTLFALNRRYAERFGGAWVVLSAKYGFVLPDFAIPGPYDTTFARKRSNPADPIMLRHQVESLGLNQYERVVEIGVTIVQRFIGTADQGYQLGLDGLVFQSVIYAKHDFQRMLFIGVNSDLSEIADARTLIVTGTYGGVQHNTDSLWEDPILIAREIDVP